MCALYSRYCLALLFFLWRWWWAWLYYGQVYFFPEVHIQLLLKNEERSINMLMCIFVLYKYTEKYNRISTYVMMIKIIIKSFSRKKQVWFVIRPFRFGTTRRREREEYIFSFSCLIGLFYVCNKYRENFLKKFRAERKRTTSSTEAEEKSCNSCGGSSLASKK